MEQNNINMETTDNDDAKLKAKSGSGIMQFVSRTLSSGNTSIGTFEHCDTGSTFLFVIETNRCQLNFQRRQPTFNLLAAREKKNSSEILR